MLKIKNISLFCVRAARDHREAGVEKPEGWTEVRYLGCFGASPRSDIFDEGQVQ